MRGTSGSQAGKVADHLRPILGCQFGIEVPLGGAGSVHLGKPASGCVPKCRASVWAGIHSFGYMYKDLRGFELSRKKKDSVRTYSSTNSNQSL